MESIAANLYDTVRGVYDERASVSSLIKMVTIAMKLVDGYKDLTGAQKKQIVTSIISRISTELVKDEKTSSEVKLFIETILPTMIDVIIDAARGELGQALKARAEGWRKKLCCIK